MKSNKNHTQITYWHLAVSKDYTDADKILANIPNTENVNRHNNTGKIPLLYAVSKNSIQIIDILLRKGGDVNFSAPNGDTPISLAIARGDPEILQSLISFGAKLSTEESQKASFILSGTNSKKSSLSATSENTCSRTNEFSLKQDELLKERRKIEKKKRKKGKIS